MLVHVTIVPLIQGGREQSEQGVKKHFHSAKLYLNLFHE